ncbi:MAG: class I adenylate-forming enzyme family protein [Syntrophomonadaceae bacterium]
MTIIDMLEHNANMYGHEICLTDLNGDLHDSMKYVHWLDYDLVVSDPRGQYRREMTWRNFDEKANRTARLLVEMGTKKGDKVAILLMNCLEWLPIYFGILKSGAVAVPLNFRFDAQEIKYCLDLSDAKAVFFGPEFSSRITEICHQVPKVEHFLYVDRTAPTSIRDENITSTKYSHASPRIDINEKDDAAIYFSSGTTGCPKAIIHTHGNLLSAARTEVNHHRQNRQDNFLCIPPLYHTGAKMHWFGSLLSGSKAVILRGSKPEWILRAVSEEKITIVWLLVPWAQDILDAIEKGDVKLEDYDLSHWRLMHIGAQPVPPSLIKRWKSYFPNHLYDTNYGLSESCGPGCIHLGIDNIHKVGSIGKSGHKWQAKITDEDGDTIAKGLVGELVVKGPGLMKGYYKNPEATAEVLKDGWLFTGDMALMDEDGFIYLVDRKKDIIISGGENIYPVQIEDYLRSHSAVKDAAVIGLPDIRVGEIVAAIVELKPEYPCDEMEIRTFCSELPRYKRPRKIIFDKVPRNPTGKIERPRLREKYGITDLIAAQTRG